jgi:hypothetical protein
MGGYSVQKHLWGMLNALTQLLNALLGSCDANQSFSERCLYGYLRGNHVLTWCYYLVNALALRESNHCHKAHKQELVRCKQTLVRNGVYVADLKDAHYWNLPAGADSWD